MAKKSRGLAARVSALEKAIAGMFAGEKAKAKKSKKSPTRKSTKTIKKKPTTKVAKSRGTRPPTARSRKKPEHGVFPDSPPIFAVDEADAEAALGIKHGRR
jgi:hypothetical protein